MPPIPRRIQSEKPPTLAPPWPEAKFNQKVGIVDERSLKKSKKHRARASGEAASLAKIIKFCRSRLHPRIGTLPRR